MTVHVQPSMGPELLAQLSMLQPKSAGVTAAAPWQVSKSIVKSLPLGTVPPA